MVEVDDDDGIFDVLFWSAVCGDIIVRRSFRFVSAEREKKQIRDSTRKRTSAMPGYMTQ